MCFLSFFVNACSYNVYLPDYDDVSKNYIISNEFSEYNNDKISWKLEYPVLNSDSDYYNEVNTLLIDEIKKLAELPYIAKDLEGYRGKVSK